MFYCPVCGSAVRGYDRENLYVVECTGCGRRLERSNKNVLGIRASSDRIHDFALMDFYQIVVENELRKKQTSD